MRSVTALLFVCACWPLSADVAGSSIITTVAGAAWTFPGDGGPALNAPISSVQQVSTDPNANVIFADTGNDIVSRLNADGTITVLAGNGIRGFSGDGGPARSAALNQPSSAVMDQAGNLYIFDSSNYRIRRVTPDGIIATYAGTGVQGSTGDNGPATQARIEPSARLAIDNAGNLFLTDIVRSVVRRITPDGTISTYAGNGQAAHAGENVPATQASLALPFGVAVDNAGNLFITEYNSSQIRKVSPDGIMTTIAGSGQHGSSDGPAASAQFSDPRGIAVAANGDLYIADTANELIRKVSKDGIVSTVAGTHFGFDFSGDGGPAVNATFRFPYDVAVDGKGTIYVADNGNERIRAVTPDGMIDTIAGNGGFRNSPDGAPATNLYLFAPFNISFDAQGNLLIADSANARIRRVNVDGSTQTIAGTGVAGYTPGFTSGIATQTLLASPRMVVADSRGYIYLSDYNVGAVYRLAPDGTLTRLNATLKNPLGLAVDKNGNLYIADLADNRILKVPPSFDSISNFAGNGTQAIQGTTVPRRGRCFQVLYRLRLTQMATC